MARHDDLRHKAADIGTRAVRAGQATDPQTGAHATPIYQTSTFVLGDIERSRRLFDGEEAGFVYSRTGNPTVKAVEEKLAALEGAEAAVAFASGMGAVAATFLSLLKQGDEVLFLGPLYGGTRALLEDMLPRFGITGRRVEDATLGSSVGASSRMIYIETPTNPTLAIHDLGNAARVARRHGMVTVVDNTFATPILSRPIEHGIDLVLHSATKYLGGHGDLLGGVVAGSAELIGEVRGEGLRHIGAVLDPHPAFLMLRGMRTLHLRMPTHCDNARAVAQALRQAPGVQRVHYPGFVDHPGHEVAARQMSDFGGMVAVEFSGGTVAAQAFLEALELVDHAVSLGDVASLACVPAQSTHRLLTPEVRSADGVSDGLVRISVGVESATDLVADVLQAARHAADTALATR